MNRGDRPRRAWALSAYPSILGLVGGGVLLVAASAWLVDRLLPGRPVPDASRIVNPDAAFRGAWRFKRPAISRHDRGLMVEGSGTPGGVFVELRADESRMFRLRVRGMRIEGAANLRVRRGQGPYHYFPAPDGEGRYTVRGAERLELLLYGDRSFRYLVEEIALAPCQECDPAPEVAAASRCTRVGGAEALVGLRAWLPPERDGVFFNGAISGSSYSIGWLGAAAGWAARAEPVLRPAPGSWAADVVKDPYVVRVGRRLHLYYSGYSNEARVWGVGLAFSDDGGKSWTRSVDPVVYPIRNTHPFPVVVHRPGNVPAWVLFYGDAGGIYSAVSADGLVWRRQPTPILKADAGSAGLLPGDVRHRDGRWVLYYGLHDGRRWSMATAEAVEIGGPYRPTGSLGWDDDGGDRRYVLTADAMAGSKALRLAPSIERGPFVGLIYDDDGWQLLHVSEVDGSGTASIAEALGKHFDKGATLVPAWGGSVTPRFVFRSGATSYLLATGFQMVPECLVEIGLLGRLERRRGGRETVVWESPAIPVVPLGAAGDWNSNSAENPVLAASHRIAPAGRASPAR